MNVLAAAGNAFLAVVALEREAGQGAAGRVSHVAAGGEDSEGGWGGGRGAIDGIVLHFLSEGLRCAAWRRGRGRCARGPGKAGGDVLISSGGVKEKDQKRDVFCFGSG